MTQRVPSNGSAVTFTYDNNGNMNSDSTGRSFTWDGLNQLTRLTAGGVTTAFAYDPWGRRTRFTQGGITEQYLYDDVDLVSDGTSHYLHGAHIDAPLSITTSSTTRSYLADHLGSITQLTESTGASDAVYRYDPYGTLLPGSTPLSANPFTYTGREDDGTGLYYYRVRYYDPKLERFISDDPLGDAQRYVGGNPVRYGDPFGLQKATPSNAEQTVEAASRCDELTNNMFPMATQGVQPSQEVVDSCYKAHSGVPRMGADLFRKAVPVVADTELDLMKRLRRLFSEDGFFSEFFQQGRALEKRRPCPDK